MSKEISLAEDRFLCLDEVRERNAKISKQTIWRMWRKGQFPKPVSISPGRVGWRLSELIASENARTAARGA